MLEQLGIEYHFGGSVASSVYGTRRRTWDIDLVAILQPSHVRRFVALLNQDYYLDEASIRDALRLRSSFNIIFFDTSMKIGIFIPKPRAFDLDELQHIQYLPLEPGGRVFPVSSPESIVLRKLEWYASGAMSLVFSRTKQTPLITLIWTIGPRSCMCMISLCRR